MPAAAPHFNNQRPGLGKIGKGDDVGRSGVGGEDAELVEIGFIEYDVRIASAQDGLADMLELSVTDDGQRPELSLTGPLKVALLIKLLDRLFCRIIVREVVRELELADAGLDGLLLCLRKGGVHHGVLSNVDLSPLFHFHDVVRSPRLVEECLRGAVDAHGDEVATSADSLDPVSVGGPRCGRAEVDVRRAVGVGFEIAVGGDGRERLAVVQQRTGVGIIEHHGPVIRGRHVGGYVQAVGCATREVVSIGITVRGKVL
jgi:hypothetical protein